MVNVDAKLKTQCVSALLWDFGLCLCSLIASP